MTSNPPTPKCLSRLLIVEDDFERLRPVVDALRDEDFNVTVCASLDAARAQAKRLDFGVVIVDLHPALPDAAWHLEQFQRASPHVQVIVHATAGTRDDVKCALNLGAFAYVDRDDPLGELVEQVHRAFRGHYRAQAASFHHRAASVPRTARQAAQLRQLVEQMPIMAVAFDYEGEVVLWNREAERVTGYSRDELAENMQVLEPIFPGILQPTARRRCLALAAEEHQQRRFQITAKDGALRTILWTHLPHQTPISGWAAWSLGWEVTESVPEWSDETLIRGAHLTLAGASTAQEARQVAGATTAIAHLADACITLARLEDDSQTPRLLQYLDQISQEARHAEDSARRLQRGMAPQTPRRATALNALLAGAVEFLQAELDQHRIRVRWDLAVASPPVMIDPAQIEQVVVALLRNAIESMIAVDPTRRELTIASRHVEDEVEVAIIDQGIGHRADPNSRWLEPCATSLPAHTGLGLACCRAIVRGHAGRVWAQPNVDAGMKFCFALPVATIL